MLSAVEAPGRPCCTRHAASEFANAGVSSLRDCAGFAAPSAAKSAGAARPAIAADAAKGAGAARPAVAPKGADALLELEKDSQPAGVVDTVGAVGATSFCLPGGG